MNPGVPTGTPDDFPFWLFIMLEETIVYLDAGYLNKLSKHFGDGNYLRLDKYRFAINVAKTKQLWIRETYYYIAPPFQSNPPTPDEVKRRAGYDKHVSYLRKIPNFYVREGRCQKINDDYSQKGVDSLIIMDLFEHCMNKRVNKIIILTCDTDFVPILNKVRKMDIKVILCYYCDYRRGSKFSMSNHLLTACDDTIFLTKELFFNSVLKEET